MSLEEYQQRITELYAKYNMKQVCGDTDPDIKKIRRFLSKKSGIPREQFECGESIVDEQLEKYAVVFPYPLDFYLILYVVYDGSFATYSVNGDKDIELFMEERDGTTHILLEAYGKAYKLSVESNAANNRISRLVRKTKKLTKRINKLE